MTVERDEDKSSPTHAEIVASRGHLFTKLLKQGKTVLPESADEDHIEDTENSA